MARATARRAPSAARLAASAAALVILGAAPAAAADAPGGDLRQPPRALGSAPPNAAFGAGLSGWSWLGRAAPAIVADPRRHARLVQNTTLISPPLVVPARAQVIPVVVRSPDGAGLLDVRAQPIAGGPQVALGTLAPGRVLAPGLVGLGPVRGRTIRLVLDPVTALGRRIDVAAIGRPREQVRRWSLPAGAVAITTRAAGRRVVIAGDAVLVSPAFRPGPGAARATVRARGSGRLRLAIGTARAEVALGRRWRRVVVAIRAPLRRARLRLEVAAGAEPIELRALGTVIRRVRIASVRRAGPDGRTVIARLRPPAAGIRVIARDRAGRAVARARTDRRGRVVLRVPASAVRLTSLADPRHLAATRALPRS